jgi:hypothetical protein
MPEAKAKCRTPAEAVALLNEAFALDPAALEILLSCRIYCNPALANHPTIQVAPSSGERWPTVGPLGLLNGIFGADANGRGYVAARYDEGRLVGFCVLEEGK